LVAGVTAKEAAAGDLAFDRLHQEAPDIAYRDGAKVQHLQDLAGQPVMLHLWATWCTSCKAELPSLARFAATLAASKVRFLAVAVDGEAQRPAVKAFLAALPGERLPPLMVDPEAGDVKPYLTWGLPATYLISADGTVVARALGARAWETTPGAASQVQILFGAHPLNP
jgi:thiol-disulfide isomerase/thioredoxin